MKRVVIRTHSDIPELLEQILRLVAVETGGKILDKPNALKYVLEQKIKEMK